MIKASRPAHRSAAIGPPVATTRPLEPERAKWYLHSQRLGDALRRQDGAIQDLVLKDTGLPLHIFECLPHHPGLRSLNLEHTRKLDNETLTFRPLEPADYDALLTYLEACPSAPPLLLVPSGALTDAQIEWLGEMGTLVIPGEQPIAAVPLAPMPVPQSMPRPSDDGSPAAPQPPALSQRHMQPWVVATCFLNAARADPAMKQLIEVDQQHVCLSGTHLTGIGCEALQHLIGRKTSPLQSLDLRRCRLDWSRCVLRGMDQRATPLDTLWIDAVSLPREAHWIALVQILMHGKLRRLVVSPDALKDRRFLGKLSELARQLVPRDVTIWEADRCIHPVEVREAPPASPPVQAEQPLAKGQLDRFELVQSLGRRDAAALTQHLLACKGQLRWPDLTISRAEAAHLGAVLCTHMDLLLGLDLSTCVDYEAVPPKLGLGAPDKTAFSVVLRGLEQRMAIRSGACLVLLVINANSLKKKDWARLTALVTQGAILKLTFTQTSEKTRLKIYSLVDAIKACNAPTLVNHD
jgi:hypothetical protein